MKSVIDQIYNSKDNHESFSMPTYKSDEVILLILIETLFYEKNESAALSLIA